MAEKFSFLVVPPNQTPPEALLAALLKNFPSAMLGVRMADETTPLDFTPVIDKPTVKDLQDYLAESSADTRVIGCYNLDRDLTEEELQPYAILKDPESGNPIMVVFMDGEFNSYEKAKSALPNSYHAAFNYLQDQIILLCEKHNDNLEEVTEYLSTTEGSKELEGDLFGGERGAIAIVAPGITEVYSHKNTLALDADWGAISNHCGFGQVVKSKFSKATTEEKPAEPPKKSKFSKDKPASPPSSPSTSTSSEEPEPEGKWLKPKVTVQGNQNRKDWYWAVSGMDHGSPIPQKLWEEQLAFGQAIFIPQAQFDKIKSKPIMTKTDVVDKPPPADRTKSAATPDTKARGTHTETKHVGGSKVPSPGMSDDTKSSVLGLFSKPGSVTQSLMADAEAKPLTGEEAAALLKKYTDWYSSLKDKQRLEVERIMSFPYEFYLEQAEIGGNENIAMLAWSNALRCIIAEAKAKDYGEQLAKLQGTKDAAATGPRAETMTAPKSRFSKKA